METETIRRVRRAARRTMWGCPFLLPLLARVTFEEADIPTMDVTAAGRIRVGASFVATLADPVLGGVVAHELMHLATVTTARGGGKDWRLWNVAADMAINRILSNCQVQLPLGALYPPTSDLDDAPAEVIYAWLKKEGYEPPPEAYPAGGCGVEGPLSPEAVEEWTEIGRTVRAMASQSSGGRALASILTPKSPRANWAAVLRGVCSRALAAHGRDDLSYTRRNRRSPEDVILPGWVAVRAKGAVIIDASGSMDDKMLHQAIRETVAIQALLIGVKVYLVIHDSKVMHAGWIDAKDSRGIAHRVTSRGGTDFASGYIAAEKAGRLDFCVHLTDGECFGKWPHPPKNARKFVFAKIGAGVSSTPPVNTIEISVDV